MPIVNFHQVVMRYRNSLDDDGSCWFACGMMVCSVEVVGNSNDVTPGALIYEPHQLSNRSPNSTPFQIQHGSKRVGNNCHDFFFLLFTMWHPI
jgi:hypothetical protein